MIDRDLLGRLAGLLGLGLGALILAACLLWWQCDLQLQLNHFYATTSGDGDTPDSVYRYWDSISRNAYGMQLIAGGLLTGTVIAAVTALAVAARRWDLEQAP